jgi:hypothetical protein
MPFIRVSSFHPWLVALLLASACADDGQSDAPSGGSGGAGGAGGSTNVGGESFGGDGGGGSTPCGNGVIDAGEACDGAELQGQTCESQGFGDGSIGCLPNCSDYDRSQCGAPATCGNGAVDDVEICDGDEHAGATCESLGLEPGELVCLPNCGGFDTTGCDAPETCNNGMLDDGEVCDGADLAGMACTDLGFGAGDLSCELNCGAFDTTECIVCDLPPFVVSQTLDLNANTVTISGVITENGADLPTAISLTTLGALVFRDVSSGDEMRVSISVDNFPGTS